MEVIGLICFGIGVVTGVVLLCIGLKIGFKMSYSIRDVTDNTYSGKGYVDERGSTSEDQLFGDKKE